LTLAAAQLCRSGGIDRYGARARAAANQLHVAAAVDRRDSRTNGQHPAHAYARGYLLHAREARVYCNTVLGPEKTVC